MVKRTAAIAALVLATLLPVTVVHHADASGDKLDAVVAATGPGVIRPDIKFTWGWITGTVYLNRSETRRFKTASYAAGIAAQICAGLAVQTFGTACLVSGAVPAQWIYTAANAYSDRKCVKIKVPTMWASAYSGGYCR